MAIFAAMDIMETNRILLEQGKRLGMCDKFAGTWDSAKTKEELVGMMYEGLDFCIEHHWPSNEFITQHFDEAFRRSVNVFVDDKYSTVNPRYSIALGDSTVTYRYNGWAIGIIHIRDDSTAKIFAKGKSHVIVHLYDRAHADIVEREDGADVVIITHSPNITFVGDATRIREE